MTSVAVADNEHAGGAWLLSVDGRDAVPAPAGTLCHGFGQTEPAPFSAVFALDGVLWLQVGTARWDVACLVAVRQVRASPEGAAYALDLEDGTSPVVEVDYPRVAAMDPTYDEIASWSDDLLKTLPHTAVDGWQSSPGTVAQWAAKVLPLWTEGFVPGT